MKAEISKVEIKIAGKILGFTLEQAKELRDILNDTFPETAPFSPAPVVIHHEYPRWYHWQINSPWCGSYVNSAQGYPPNTLQLSAIN